MSREVKSHRTLVILFVPPVIFAHFRAYQTFFLKQFSLKVPDKFDPQLWLKVIGKVSGYPSQKDVTVTNKNIRISTERIQGLGGSHDDHGQLGHHAQ